MHALHLIDPSDNVAVALRQLEPGETVSSNDSSPDSLIVRELIPSGHKVALRAIAAGNAVVKYGWPIGRARCDIEPGSLVHSQNLSTQLTGLNEYEYQPDAPFRAGISSPPHSLTFMGYRRRNGRVGTRNEIWVVTTVGCVSRTAERIARLGSERFAGRVDGVHALTHPFGCSQLGDDLEHTRKLLASLIVHPNAGGVLVVGLGCESNQLSKLLAEVGDYDSERIRSFSAQASDDEIEEGLAALQALVAIVECDEREPCPLAALTIGLKCGGSDGFSGITANPLVGRVADQVCAAGGTPILTEIPEVFGAEQLLMRRSVDAGVFADVVSVVNRFKQYFLDHGQPIYENPSPGNIAGGITTLEEKSLGAVQKGGHAPVSQVLLYGERARKPGLALLEAPGNDAVSSTALVAAGATILLFTTGRGTPLGFPVPTLKIASNSALAQKKPRWIDFDAGPVLAGTNLEQAASQLMQLILDTASGKPARNELNDEREIAIWKTGVTL
ncbi:MAG: altronate dehydratase [Proteobacteria bacterium]|nr:altronate dehydratase [Pseudomonadota bacterium]